MEPNEIIDTKIKLPTDILKELIKYVDLPMQLRMMCVNRDINQYKNNVNIIGTYSSESNQCDDTCRYNKTNCHSNKYYVYNEIDVKKWWFDKIQNIHIKKSKFIIPSHANTIYFDTYENNGSDIMGVHFPTSLKHIIFGHNFDREIIYPFTETITKIVFIGNFDRQLRGILPRSLKKIVFGYLFNQSIENTFPDGIEHIEFGNNFNKSVVNNIPNSVKILIFGDEFNQNLSVLPHNLRILELGKKFDNNIFFSNEITLEKLIVKCAHLPSIINVIPTLTELVIHYFKPRKSCHKCCDILQLCDYLFSTGKTLYMNNVYEKYINNIIYELVNNNVKYRVENNIRNMQMIMITTCDNIIEEYERIEKEILNYLNLHNN